MVKSIFDQCYTDAIACSKKAGEWIFQEGKYTVLSNAIDTKQYAFSSKKRNAIRKKYGMEQQFVLCHVGKINEQKNHAFLIDIFAEILQHCPSVRLLCVGDGPLRTRILEQANNYGIEDKIIITGMKKNVCDYLSASDCFVFPSLWEGLPLSLVEAQASGLPCVVSDKITTEANVTGKVHYLSLKLPVSDWVKQILTFMDDDYRVSECKNNIQLIIENGFSIQKNADRLRAIYFNEEESVHV